MTTRAELIDAVVAVMVREGGRLAEWHSWRCEYPDRYGECNCNEAVAAEIVAEILPLIADAIERVRDVDFAEAMAEPDVECEYTSRECHANASHAAYSVAARLVRRLLTVGQDGG